MIYESRILRVFIAAVFVPAAGLGYQVAGWVMGERVLASWSGELGLFTLFALALGAFTWLARKHAELNYGNYRLLRIAFVAVLLAGVIAGSLFRVTSLHAKRSQSPQPPPEWLDLPTR